MSTTKESNSRTPRRQWPPAEKRRIIELTLRPGASVLAVAREHDVNPNSLYRWKRHYRGGKHEVSVKPMSVAGPATSATFVPVSLVSAIRDPQPAAHPDAAASRSGIVQLVLASGATLRIETGALDSGLVCALVAELRR